MGMFDTIECYYPIPNIIEGTSFQTKSFNSGIMDNYTITKEGELILHKVSWEMVPEEERPYYSKPEWKTNKLLRLSGSIKTVFEGNEKIEYHGIVNMYTHDLNNDFFEFDVKFTDGKIESIKQIEREY